MGEEVDSAEVVDWCQVAKVLTCQANTLVHSPTALRLSTLNTLKSPGKLYNKILIPDIC